MLVRPSPSESALGSAETMVRVLPGEGADVELPVPFVATRVNDPAALDASVRVIVAEVLELMTTFEIVTAGGLKAGAKENVAPVRLVPVTWKGLIVGALST